MEKLAFRCNIAIISATLAALICLKLYIVVTGNINARWAMLLIANPVAVVWLLVWILGLVGLLRNQKKKEPAYVRIGNQSFLFVAVFVAIARYA